MIDAQRQAFENAERLVRNEVKLCLSSLVYDMVNHDPGHYMEDLQDVLSRPQYMHTFTYECGCGHSWEIESNDPSPENLESFRDIDDPSEHQANCPECKEPNEPTDVSSKETDAEEAYEHWAVTSWLARKLEEHGEMVTNYCNIWIWGRTCTGQAIALDHVIQVIANPKRDDK